MSNIVTGLAQALGADVEGLDWVDGPGGNVFEDDMPTEPDTAVGVYSTGGLPASSSAPFDAPTVQIVVRGDGNPETAKALWWAIYDYLHAKRYVDLPDGTHLAWALVVQSGPFRMGADQNGRHRFSMNVQCETRRPSTHREETP